MNNNFEHNAVPCAISASCDVLLDRFLDSLRVERGLSAHTVRAYSIDVTDFLRWTQRVTVDPLQVDHRSMRRYLAELDKARYARKTINRRLSAVKTFYRWLVDIGTLEYDPLSVVVGPKQSKSLPHKVGTEDMDKLLEVSDTGTVSGLRNQAILELLYACGARIAEVAALKVGDVNFDSQQVKVMGKGSKERIIPLHSLAIETLRLYLLNARPNLERKAKKPTNALFLSTRGNAMGADAMRKMFKASLREAGLDLSFSPHDMRHTFASDLVEEGADLRSVQEMLGHASLSTTQIYTHLSTGHLKDVHRSAHPRA